jgi:hypothetical protein
MIHGFAYLDDDATLIELITFLMKQRTWFDIRIPRDHRWQITYSSLTAKPVPAKLAKKLIGPEPTKQRDEKPPKKDVVAAVKAQRKKERKGTRR